MPFMEKYTREAAVLLLKEKHAALLWERYPKRSDFTDAEVMAIKAYLGPWPRALEAAGIKPARDDDRAEKSRQRRIRAKRNRREYKKNTGD